MKTFPKSLLPSLAIIAIACFAIFYAVCLFDYGYIHGDEGIALMGGWRIFLGQIPHRDFFEFIPPFSSLLLALFFTLFGPGFFAERLLVMALALALIVVCDRLLRHYSQNRLARCLAATFLIPYGVMQWPLPSYHWVVDILQIMALYSLASGLCRPSLWWGVCAGACTVLGCFSMQDQGGYLLIALAVLFFPLIDKQEIRKKLLLGWCLGGVVVAGAFAIYLLPQVSLTELVYQWVVFPATRYKNLPGNDGSLLNLGLQEIGTPGWLESLRQFPDYTLPQTLFSILLPLLPLLSLVTLGLIFAKEQNANKARLGLLAAGGIAFIGGCLHRFSQTNLVWAAPILITILAVGIGRVLDGGSKQQRFGAQVVASGLIGLSLLYMAGDLRLKLTSETTRVSGAAGTLVVPARSTQASMQIVIDGIEKNVPQGAPVFCTESNAMVNFWTLRPNPTRFNFFISPILHTEAQTNEALTALDSHPESYVLLFMPFPEDDHFGEQVSQTYRVVWRFPWALLLKKK